MIALFAFLLLASAPAWGAEGPVPGEGFVMVTGGPVWYQVTGTGDGLPLLALHGGPGSTSCGFAALDPLGSERPLIRYDQLGTGRSGRPADLSLWTVERFVEELHAVRRQLGLERLHLLGHSWGGSLAAAYVLEKGTEGIVSLTLSSPLLSTPLWLADANLLRAQLPEEVQRTLSAHETAGTTDSEEYEAAAEVFYERHVYGGEKPPEAEACAGAPWNPVIYEHMWGPTEFYATGSLLDFDVTGRLHEIDIPEGRKTRMYRVAARYLETGEQADDHGRRPGHFGSVQYRLLERQSGMSARPGLMRISNRFRTADSSAWSADQP